MDNQEARDLARAFFVSKGAAFPALAVQDNPDLVEAFAFARSAVLEEAACYAESEAAMSVFRSETCSEDMAAEFCFQADFAASLAAGIRALTTTPEPTDPAGSKLEAVMRSAAITGSEHRYDITDPAGVSGVVDWWEPEPEDPFWMLEAEDGEWLKNGHTVLGTRDATKALRFPTERDAYNHPARMMPAYKWWAAKPTEHLWANFPAALRTPDPVLEVVKEALDVLVDAVGRYREVGPLKGVRRDLAKGYDLGVAALQTINERGNSA